MNKKFLLIALFFLILWMLSRRKSETSSVNITADGKEIFQDCRYSNGSRVEWPVSQGACPLMDPTPGKPFNEGILIITGAGISK